MLFEAGYFRGRPFDFWGGGGGGIGDLGKKYPADWFQGEKNLARKYLGEKIPVLKKISLIVYNTGKKSLTLLYVREEILSPEVWGKNSYPNQITHTPPPPPTKVKWSAPELFFFHFLQCLSYCSHIWFERSLPLTQIFNSTSKLFMTI